MSVLIFEKIITFKLMNTEKTKITIEAIVNAPIEKVWKFWNEPNHITKWNSAHPSWHCPTAENDLRTGGKISSRMEAVDGSTGFDFWGIYTEIINHELIAYTLGDDRKVEIQFSTKGNTTKIIETFEAESENPIEMQQGGWQAILDNFKKYTEEN